MNHWLEPGGTFVSLLIGLYAVPVLVGLAVLFGGRKFYWNIATAFMLLAFAANLALIGLMWDAAGRPPFKSRYETFILYPACLAPVALALLFLHRLRVVLPPAGAVCVLFMILAKALPDLETELLPPALQSGWFVPHVVAYFIAYAAIIVTAVLAAIALIQGPGIGERKSADDAPQRDAIPFETATYKTAVFGFVMLSAGLAMGAFWAKAAWGDYWTWDAKENWALISWFCSLIYLHVRAHPRWSGRPALWICLLCAGVVIFCWLGVNYLPAAQSSLHVYQ
jgi:cytochrome c-type biogenesis protein CcsB